MVIISHLFILFCFYLNCISIISLFSESFLSYLNSKQSPLFKHSGNKSVTPFSPHLFPAPSSNLWFIKKR